MSDSPTPAKTRRARGQLEGDVMSILGQLNDEVIDFGGKPVTGYRIAQAIEKMTSEKAPSFGAVDAVLKRWEKIGFIVTAPKPFAFVCFTEEAETVGLAGLRARYHASKPQAASAPAPAII